MTIDEAFNEWSERRRPFSYNPRAWEGEDVRAAFIAGWEAREAWREQ